MEQETDSVGQPEGSAQKDGAKESVSYETYSRILGEIKRVKETNSKVMDDFKKAQEELRELRDSQQIKELESSGRTSELITSLKDENRKLLKTVESKEAMFKAATIENRLRAEAANHGCVDSDALIRLLGKNKISSVRVDENFQPDQDDLAVLIEESKKQYENLGLFKRGKVNVNDATLAPKFDRDVKPPSEMDQDALAAEIKNQGGFF